ncbi:glycosyltransferase family 4 protein [Effusibacillus consociatus]|uniref:Glycosyltransferase family 4 protein n=1 Tax=Effusibacillus consociatus TaxID=1117041 RepID=A0ABV9Q411_9BACL
MKILIASSFLLPSVGGLWNYVEQLTRGLRRSGHEADILARDPHSENYYILNQGDILEATIVRGVVRPKITSFFLRQISDMDPWINEREIERYSLELASSYFNLRKYDLIHTQDIIATTALSRVKPGNTPLIATIHGCLLDEYMDKHMIRGKNTLSYHYGIAQEYYGITSSNITIVPSVWFKNYLKRKFGIPDHHLTVVYNGMDTELFRNRMKNTESMLNPPDKYIIACTARLSPEKGHIYLLEALGKLKKERNDWVCWLIGDGPLRTELEELSRHLKISDNVIFLGNRDDVPSLLNEADIFVLSSLQESLSYAVIEAQIAGKPILATEAGGITEVVAHGKTGLLSPVGQSEPLYRNLIKVLDDELLRKTLAKNAKLFGEKQWSLTKMIENTLNIYNKFYKLSSAPLQKEEA